MTVKTYIWLILLGALVTLALAVVTVRMKDDRALSAYQGSEDRRKLTGQEVLAKYRRNVEIGRLSAVHIQRSIELMEKFET